MVAYFCEKTGVRIAAPGVCKAVDPINGQDEYSERAVEAHPAKPSAKPAKVEAPEKPQPHKGDDK